jgi:hypothetical protein
VFCAFVFCKLPAVIAAIAPITKVNFDFIFLNFKVYKTVYK